MEDLSKTQRTENYRQGLLRTLKLIQETGTELSHGVDPKVQALALAVEQFISGDDATEVQIKTAGIIVNALSIGLMRSEDITSLLLDTNMKFSAEITMAMIARKSGLLL